MPSVSTQLSLKQLDAQAEYPFTTSYRRIGTISSNGMDIISAEPMVSRPSHAGGGASTDETHPTWVIRPQATLKE